MHAEVLPARPGVLHEHVGHDVLDLPHDVQFAQAVEAVAQVGDGVELVAVGGVDLADGVQPVVDEAAPLAVDGRRHAAAPVMSDHQDVLHLEHVHGELKHREVVGVLGWRQVRDVAMDKQLARVEVDDLVGGHAAVRAADPQVFGRLLALEALEEARIGGGLAGRPVAVLGLEGVEHGGRVVLG